jgi:DNA-binding NarL/FixJ family response regulator
MVFDLENRWNVLIAHRSQNTWATDLAGFLAHRPVDLHWPQSEAEAICLVSERPVHLAVVDDQMPSIGGLALLRRIRRLGLEMPAVLVSPRPDPRILREALELGVFSVVDEGTAQASLVPQVVKVFQRFYQVEWPFAGTDNRN